MKFAEDFFKKEIREEFEITEMMKRAWAAQMEILQVVIEVCQKNGLQYFADWGTLLGAVRHHGFIPCGETLLELLVDITENGDGPIGKYIAKNGQGIQHIAVRVDDVQAAIDTTIEKGAAMIDKAPRGGAGGMDIAFVHPKSVGILLEYCAPAKK